MSLSLQFADPRRKALLPRHKVIRWMRAALELPGEITVRIVDAGEGQSLNREYRSKDYATNVLTFDYTHEPVVAADLVICAEVVEREAKGDGAGSRGALRAHAGPRTLHAQGYDHEEDDEAEFMEARETEVMLGLGFADPYAKTLSTTAACPVALAPEEGAEREGGDDRDAGRRSRSRRPGGSAAGCRSSRKRRRR